MDKEQKKKLYKLGLPIIFGTILLIGVSYAWLTLVLSGSKTNVLKSGTLSLIINEDEEATINLENASPISTEEGLMLNGYHFTVKNNGDIPAMYSIYLDDAEIEEGTTRIDPKYIRYSLEKDNTLITEGSSDLLSNLENNLLMNETIGVNGEHKYIIRLWVDYEADSGAMNKVYSGKLRLEAKQMDQEDSCFVTNQNTITGYNTKDSEGNACPKDVVIPSNIGGFTITAIGNSAFSNRRLTSVVIPNTVTTIGAVAFARNKITSVMIPSSVISLGEGAFYDNQLPDNEAFIYNRNSDGTIDYTSLNSYGGANRDNVVFPETLKIIGANACYSSSLRNITLPEGLEVIKGDAFNTNSLTSLSIPSSVTTLQSTAFVNNQLNDEDAFIYRRTSSGEDRSYLLTYAGAKKEGVVIPSNITTIGASSFQDAKIISITIPSSVTSIENFAFRNNSLTSIEIPSTVTSIGQGAFNNNSFSDEDAFVYARTSTGDIDNTTLVSYAGATRDSVVIPETVTTIMREAFYAINIKAVTLPSGLESIGTLAFAACQLTSVTIPSTVTTIDNSAFAKTASWNPNLTTIVNNTGRSFDWGLIVNRTSGYNFVTGTVSNTKGNVSITSS